MEEELQSKKLEIEMNLAEIAKLKEDVRSIQMSVTTNSFPVSTESIRV
jgi:hypothetical protein